MLNVTGFILVMLKGAAIVALLNLPSPVAAFAGLKNWSRKALYTKVDLCTQSCYSQIIPGLYLSNAHAAKDRNVLEALKITHVITVESQRIPPSVFEEFRIATLFIKANDSIDTQLLPYFPIANEFIDGGLVMGGQVLVHCHFGVSRSATIVIAYLMQRYILTFEQAFSYVRKRRRFINPNPGFVAQLREYHRRGYSVGGLQRFDAYIHVNAGENKFKVVSLVVVLVGIIVPALLLFGI